MQPLQQAKDIWKKMFDSSTLEPTTKHSVGFYNKLSRVFSVGPYYYYVFNVQQTEIEYVSKSVETLLGCADTEFSVQYAMSNIHPDDMSYFLDFESASVDFLKSLPPEKAMKYKIQYDFRIRKKNQSYMRVLQQSITLEQGPNGEVVRALGMHTDITHIKKEGKPLLSFIGMDGEPSFIDVTSGVVLENNEELLSKREKEILFYLICGNSSEEIAAILFLSKETISTHRRNMLKKTRSKNTNELVAKAIKGGAF